MDSAVRTIWATRPQPNPHAGLRLFCLPHAGGGPQVFRSWPAGLPSTVEVAAVLLPGRGQRFREPPIERLAPLVEAMAVGLEPLLDRPFALYGHSMGAFLAFELARRLAATTGQSPTHLFVSGAGAPQIPDRHRFHALPDEQFLTEVGRISGGDDDLLSNRELMALMLPVLRADFAVAETYVASDPGNLPCPISVFGGADDWLVPVADLDGWRRHTHGACHVDVLPGDHFFVRSAERSLLNLMSGRLANLA